MKKVIAILFLLVIFFQNFNQLVILAGFHLNNSYIIRNLCENRDKPQLHCKGKCFLSKKFKEEEKQSQSPFAANKKEVHLQLFFASQGFDMNTSGGRPAPLSYYSYNELETRSVSNYIFHPPGA